MNRMQPLHGVILPLAWFVLVLLLWHWPGDKGLSFYFGSIVGAWVHEQIRLTGSAYLVGQCVGGLPIMFGIGWLLDRHRIGPIIYAVYLPFVALAVSIRFRCLPDMLMMLCWGLYAVGVAGLIVLVFKLLKIRRRGCARESLHINGHSEH